MENNKFEYKLNGEVYEASYVDRVPFTKMLEIVDTVADACTDGHLDYSPILKKFFTDVEIIRSFTDVKLPEDINECYEFIQNTDIIMELSFTKQVGQIYTIETAIDETVEYLLDKKSKANPLNDLAISATQFINTLAEKLSETDIEQLKNAMSSLSELLKNIPPEDVQAFVKSLTAEPKKRKSRAKSPKTGGES